MSNYLKKKELHDPVFSVGNKIARVLWWFAYNTIFRFSPVQFFRWRVLILRCFGAKVSCNARIYPSVKIWMPSNLAVSDGATIGPRVNVYNQGFISVLDSAIVSQGVHLCASTHDYNDPLHPLVVGPINIGSNSWVCTEAFVGPGVSLGEGSVIAARAVQVKDADPWWVHGGNPSVKLKERCGVGFNSES